MVAPDHSVPPSRAGRLSPSGLPILLLVVEHGCQTACSRRDSLPHLREHSCRSPTLVFVCTKSPPAHQRRDCLGFITRRPRPLQFQPHPERHRTGRENYPSDTAGFFSRETRIWLLGGEVMSLVTGRVLRTAMLASALAATASNATAQDGDVAAGRAFAREACVTCHIVDPANASPRVVVIGPKFQDIANTNGMTATALRVFLTTSHPKMPNLILTPEQIADVSAYILSLREQR